MQANQSYEGAKAPRHPLTNAERQTRRQSRLDKIAQALGYETWRKLETAALKGEVKITKES